MGEKPSNPTRSNCPFERDVDRKNREFADGTFSEETIPVGQTKHGRKILVRNVRMELGHTCNNSSLATRHACERRFDNCAILYAYRVGRD